MIKYQINSIYVYTKQLDSTTTCAAFAKWQSRRFGWYWADFFHASRHIWLGYGMVMVTWDVTQVCVKHWGFSSSDVSKWSVFLQTQKCSLINDQLGPRADRKHPHKPSMSGTAIVPLHRRHRTTCQLCLIPAMQQPIQHVCVNAIMIAAQFLAKSAPASPHCACAQQLPIIWQDAGDVDSACAARSWH